MDIYRLWATANGKWVLDDWTIEKNIQLRRSLWKLGIKVDHADAQKEGQNAKADALIRFLR